MNEPELISKYLGTPFKWGGKTLEGMDCWQFFRSVYADLGHQIWAIEDSQYPNLGDYSHNLFVENYHRDWEEIKTPGRFDAVLMKTRAGVPNHVGVVLSNGRFIHCPRVGVVVSRLDEPAWSPRISGYFRLKAMKNDNA